MTAPELSPPEPPANPGAAAGGSTAVLAATRELAPDPFDARRALRADGILATFNQLDVLSAADVHVAAGLAGLAPGQLEDVALAVALTVRALRLGHVCVDLATVRDTIITDAEAAIDVLGLPWPEPGQWLKDVAASELVACGDRGQEERPLRLTGARLYLDRYWRQERQVAADLRARSDGPAAEVAFDQLRAGLDRLFGAGAADEQRLAAAVAVLRRFAVIAGGPGTGKTTTIARTLVLLDEQASALGAGPLRIALAAPTGKAAARLEEAVHAEAMTLPIDPATRQRLLGLSASTLHRLLGWRPASRSRFRHDRTNRLPHDVVVVDETSMVSLSLMAKLVDAVRSESRLVLVGDPEQLASVEAGAVLGDIVGPASFGPLMRPAARLALSSVVGHDVVTADPPPGSSIGDGIVVLRRVHRFGGGIATLADAIHDGDGDAAIALLGSGGDDVRWIDVDVADGTGSDAPSLARVRAEVIGAARLLTGYARAGQGRPALDTLGAMRLLCAHRRGPYGVSTWTAQIERWLAGSIDHYGAGGPWYVGRPLLVTENDYELQLYNGDTGVVVASGHDGLLTGGGDGPGQQVTAVFERRQQLLEISPTRLSAIETVHAMTVHKSQGSQFDAVVLVLPDPTSPMLTRELLYTGVTRARRQLTVVSPQASILAAVGRPIARASGLAERLWS